MANSPDSDPGQVNAEPGTRKLFQIAGVWVVVHWSLPAVVLVVSVLPGLGLDAALTVCLAYFGLIVIHELAHALAARYSGLRVYSLTFSAVGGLCRYDTPRTFGSALAVAFAGVLAQLLVLIASQTYLSLNGEPHARIGNLLLLVFIYVNAFLILINLVPQKPRHETFGSDGYLIWKLAARKVKGQPFAYPDMSVTFSPETHLLGLPGFRPEGFASGMEILNDNSTPMEFVVDVLSRHLDMSREEAIKLMLSTHFSGGILIPLPRERAEAAVAAIADDAAAAGHPLVCRVALPEQFELRGPEPRIRAPWSNQKAGVLTRILAVIFVIAGVASIGYMIVAVWRHGLAPSLSGWRVAVDFVLSAYIIALFGRVVISGRAPKGWIPWR